MSEPVPHDASRGSANPSPLREHSAAASNAPSAQKDDAAQTVSTAAPQLESPQALPSLPIATIKPERRVSFAWFLPLLALALAGYLGVRAWQQRGLPVEIYFTEGHGLMPGDEVRYRGITVGYVDDVTLAPDLQGVVVRARLTSQADQLARSGTRFWIVRPQIGLTRVAGLETIVGPRVLAVSPATTTTATTQHAGDDDLQPQFSFVGLEQPPVVESIQPGDLEVVLHVSQRGSLHPGAPVMYRQFRVGTVMSVGLAGDGGAIEARLHIQKAYVPLIRSGTKFWDAGGMQAKLGLTGLSVEIESAEALLTGGVALATPPSAEAGDMVRTGHRFLLAEKPDTQWLQWQPMIAIGNSLLPSGVPSPHPLRASIGWKQGRFFTGERSRHGWVLQTAEGILGPIDLLKPGEKADPATVVLEVAGTVVPLEQKPAWEHHGIGLLKTTMAAGVPVWSQRRVRTPIQPEECLAIADPAAMPLPLAASRLTMRDDGATWRIDASVPIDSSWHGACVVSRVDGQLLGIVLANGREPIVALLPPAQE